MEELNERLAREQAEEEKKRKEAQELCEENKDKDRGK